MNTRFLALVTICCLTNEAFAQTQQSSVELLAVGRLSGDSRDLSGLTGTLETDTPADQLGGFSAIDYSGHRMAARASHWASVRACICWERRHATRLVRLPPPALFISSRIPCRIVDAASARGVDANKRCRTPRRRYEGTARRRFKDRSGPLLRDRDRPDAGGGLDLPAMGRRDVERNAQPSKDSSA